jgi:arsenate reductase
MKPSGYVHPVALRVLKEIGIRHLGKSKHIDDVKDIQFDLVITVCDSAAEECPVWLGKGIRKHVGFPDPAQENGTESEIVSAFRSVRDDIASKVPGILDRYRVKTI